MKIPSIHFPGENVASLAGFIRLVVCTWLICCAWITSSTSARSADPIKIGAVLPFSGGVELYGKQAKLGLELAAKEINAGDGILGRPVEVIYEDDKTDPAAAVDATRKLIERDGALAVVGPITSRNLNAIAPVIEGMKTPLLYATNYEGGKCSRYIFSLSTVPNQEVAQLLPYMNRTFGNTYFLLGADRTWPHKMFEAAEPIIAKLGGHVVGKEFTTGKETDFTAMIARIAATKAKILLFALKGDGLNFIPQADDLGLLKATTVAFLGLSETDLRSERSRRSLDAIMTEQMRRIAALMVFCAALATPLLGSAKELNYGCAPPPLEVTFAIVDGRYNGAVGCGNLFLQSDIPTAPLVRWQRANAGKFYTLMMLDLDGKANGSWPDPVAPGQNAPVRHWIVGNIPGDLLGGAGYLEDAGAPNSKKIAVLQRYRAPHIPVVSDRYGVYLFPQEQEIDFAALPDSITSFDYVTFLERYRLGDPEASNFFVAIYTSESPFSGKAFHGNDVSGVWHRGYGKGKLAPAR